MEGFIKHTRIEHTCKYVHYNIRKKPFLLYPLKIIIFKDTNLLGNKNHFCILPWRNACRYYANYDAELFRHIKLWQNLQTMYNVNAALDYMALKTLFHRINQLHLIFFYTHHFVFKICSYTSIHFEVKKKNPIIFYM